MAVRSLLFVPGDSERKFNKAMSGRADALIFDLEDSVSAERAGEARGLIGEWLRAHPAGRRTKQFWVRINPLSHPSALADLVAVVGGQPDVVFLPKTQSGADVRLLADYLTVLEERENIERGAIKIVPVATETPESLLSFSSYVGASPRLAGLTWGAEDLAAALQASTNRLPDGSYEMTYRLARSFCLLGARAAGVEPIDTIWADYRDPEGLKTDAELGRRAGFTGKVAIHPDQIDIINAAFAPSDEEISYAKQVVQAFEGGGVGTVGLNGKMLDMPHLKQARTILAMAAEIAAKESDRSAAAHV